MLIAQGSLILEEKIFQANAYLNQKKFGLIFLVVALGLLQVLGKSSSI